MQLKQIFKGVAIATLASTIFFACKPNVQQDNEITYDSIIVAKHIPLLESNDTTLPYSEVNIRFKYPVKFRNQEDLTRLQQIFTDTFFNDSINGSLTPLEAMGKYLDAYTTEYKTLAGMYNDDKARLPANEIPAWYWYQLNNTNKILFQNDSLLSYAVEYSDYTGGAHGSYRVSYFNVDLKSLSSLSEEDLFKPGYKKELTGIVLRQLMKENNVTSADSLIDKGFFDIKDIVPNNNFWLDDKGLHYSFNQYEIAPYAMGIIDVSIPYDELSSILKPESVVSVFLKK